MSQMPALMLPLGLRPTQLCKSKCVNMLIDERTGRVTIIAHRGDDVDAGCAITGIMESTNALLARGKEYSVVWDLRDSPVPGFRDTMRLAKWGLSKKSQLERLTTKMGVIMPDGPVASVAGGLLATFSGVPTVISSDPDEVDRLV